MGMSTKSRSNALAFATRLSVFLAYIGSSLCLGQGTTIYRDRFEFEAAISGIIGSRTDLDFQPPFPPGGIDQGVIIYPPLLTISGLTFQGAGVLVIRDSAPGQYWLNNYDSLMTPLLVDMNSPARAFGADFASLLSPFYSSFLATVTLDNGSVFTFTAPADPNSTFFGFVTTQPFSMLTFSDGGLVGIGLHGEILDNITVMRVPEPGVRAILAVGALFLCWRWRRWRKFRH
jgi:hypothetical protein